MDFSALGVISMNYAELLGRLIADAEDPIKATDVLLRALTGQRVDEIEWRVNAIDPELVNAVRKHLPADAAAVASACQQGLAWIEGRKSVGRIDIWRLVATIPPDLRAPASLRHETGETIIQLANRTRSSLILISPFLDQKAMFHLKTPVAAAISRGVIVEWMVTQRTRSVSRMFREVFADSLSIGGGQGLKVYATVKPYPWPHLKVVLSDDTEAYIGSANITSAALEGRNIELGVLIKGEGVAAIKEIVDLIPYEPL